MPSNRLLFTAMIAVGGILVGGIGAAGALPRSAQPAPSHSRAATVPRGTTAPLPTPATPTSPANQASDRATLIKPTAVTSTVLGDDYANPYSINLATGKELFLNIDGATTEKYEPTSLDPHSDNRIVSTMWVTWRAPANGSLTLRPGHSGTVAIPAVAVFTGSTMATAKRVGWATAEGLGPLGYVLASLKITRGVTYHLELGAMAPAGSTRTGLIDMLVGGNYDPPANDDKSDAIPVSGTPRAPLSARHSNPSKTTLSSRASVSRDPVRCGGDGPRPQTAFSRPHYPAHPGTTNTSPPSSSPGPTDSRRSDSARTDSAISPSRSRCGPGSPTTSRWETSTFCRSAPSHSPVVSCTRVRRWRV